MKYKEWCKQSIAEGKYPIKGYLAAYIVRKYDVEVPWYWQKDYMTDGYYGPLSSYYWIEIYTRIVMFPIRLFRFKGIKS